MPALPLPKGVVSQIVADARQEMFYLNGEVMQRNDETVAQVSTMGQGDLARAYVSFYEVMRCKNHVVLFSGEHFTRLCKGIDKKFGGSVPLDTRTAWAKAAWDGVEALVAVHPPVAANVRVTLHIPTPGTNDEIDADSTVVVCATFVDAPSPTKDMYVNGCDTIFVDFERADPNLKVWDDRMKQAIKAALQESGCYEALLVRQDGTVTEGSRSNVFVVRDGEVFTAPDEDVLQGVTRQAVCQVCEEQGIKLTKRRLMKAEVATADAVVITGTTPGVLPVRTIKDTGAEHALKSASNETVALLARLYEVKAFGIDVTNHTHVPAL
jgi:branched-chain amino acid aminotransferase